MSEPGSISAAAPAEVATDTLTELEGTENSFQGVERFTRWLGLDLDREELLFWQRSFEGDERIATPERVVKTLQLFGLDGEVTRRRSVASLSPDRPRILFDKKRGAIGALLPPKDGDSRWTFAHFRPELVGLDPAKALGQSLREGIDCLTRERADRAHLANAAQAEGAGRRSWFWSALWAYRTDFLSVVPASFLINAFALAMPLFIMNVYDRVIPNHAMETLWVLTIGVAILFTFEFMMRLARGAFVDSAGKGADRELSQKIFRHMLAIDLGFRPPSAGNFASQARAYEAVRDFLSAASLVTLVDLPFAMMMFMVIFVIAGPIGWVPVVTSSLAISFLLLLQPFLRGHTDKNYQNTIRRQSLMTESANALETIKAANADVGLEARMDGEVLRSSEVELRARRLSQLGTSFTALCIHMTTVGIIVFGAYLVASQSLSMGALIASVMIAGRSMAPLNQVSQLLLRLQGTLAALRGLDDLMALPQEVRGNELSYVVTSPEFRVVNANLTYPGQPIASLESVNLTIKPGEKVGIIGRAGSGKTTLLRLLSRQLNPSQGLVMINGIDMRQLHPADIRSACGYLPQDGVLLYGTVRENIALGRSSATDIDILRAARESRVTDWTNRHPEGLNMQVGERGILLSGGQRQTVLWARCLLTQPQALLLDEPTASLDLQSERQFAANLNRYLGEHPDRTLILSTHKMHLLELVTRLIVVDQGRIVADGPKLQVLAALRQEKKRKQAENDQAGTDTEDRDSGPAEPSADS